MASCLQLPMASSYSIPSSTTFLTSSINRVSSIKSRFIVNAVADPTAAFIKKLLSSGLQGHNQLSTPRQRQGYDGLPLLDVFNSPTLMVSDAEIARSAASYNDGQRRRRANGPPDIASAIYDGRIVYIGMPLVPLVTELIVAELLYLHYLDSESPIYLYINSTGTTRDDGETVALETEGFAIYDVMRLMKNEIYTLALGYAIGQACLLLAAGTTGRRFMMPHAQAMIHQPRIPSSRLMQASDVEIRAKELITNRDTFVRLMAKHTGNSEETVLNAMNGPYYMDAKKAKEFGVIDQVLPPPIKEMKKDDGRW